MKARAALLVLWAASGCALSNLTPGARFSESAHTLNDSARWGQLSVASEHVAPTYQASFADRHRGWGSRINIAEVEIKSLVIAPDKESATSEVMLNWYDQSTMTLESSLITQRWDVQRGSFLLAEESVREGNPHIFAENQDKP